MNSCKCLLTLVAKLSFVLFTMSENVQQAIVRSGLTSFKIVSSAIFPSLPVPHLSSSLSNVKSSQSSEDVSHFSTDILQSSESTNPLSSLLDTELLQSSEKVSHFSTDILQSSESTNTLSSLLDTELLQSSEKVSHFSTDILQSSESTNTLSSLLGAELLQSSEKVSHFYTDILQSSEGANHLSSLLDEELLQSSENTNLLSSLLDAELLQFSTTILQPASTKRLLNTNLLRQIMSVKHDNTYKKQFNTSNKISFISSVPSDLVSSTVTEDNRKYGYISLTLGAPNQIVNVVDKIAEASKPYNNFFVIQDLSNLFHMMELSETEVRVTENSRLYSIIHNSITNPLLSIVNDDVIIGKKDSSVSSNPEPSIYQSFMFLGSEKDDSSVSSNPEPSIYQSFIFLGSRENDFSVSSNPEPSIYKSFMFSGSRENDSSVSSNPEPSIYRSFMFLGSEKDDFSVSSNPEPSIYQSFIFLGSRENDFSVSSNPEPSIYKSFMFSGSRENDSSVSSNPEPSIYQSFMFLGSEKDDSSVSSNPEPSIYQSFIFLGSEEDDSRGSFFTNEFHKLIRPTSSAVLTPDEVDYSKDDSSIDKISILEILEKQTSTVKLYRGLQSSHVNNRDPTKFPVTNINDNDSHVNTMNPFHVNTINPFRLLSLRFTEDVDDGLDSDIEPTESDSMLLGLDREKTKLKTEEALLDISSSSSYLFEEPSYHESLFTFPSVGEDPTDITAPSYSSTLMSNMKRFSHFPTENYHLLLRISNISSNAVRTMLKSPLPLNILKTISTPYVQSSHAFGPEILNSRLVTQKNDFIPTAPFTGLAPVFYLNSRPSQVSNAKKGKEPEVITEPIKFYFTVTHSTGRSGISKEREQGDSIVQNEHVVSDSKIGNKNTTDVNVYNFRSELSVRESDVKFIHTNSGESILETRSETNQFLSPQDLGPTKNRNYEEIVTVYGSGTLSDDTTKRTSRWSFPTGRPYVVPIDIEDVRPFVGSGPSDGLIGNNNTPRFPSGKRGQNHQTRPGVEPPLHKAPFRPRPPIIRIDTCIIGDASSCDVTLNEWCKTELGISACHCRPGYARPGARGPSVVSFLLVMKADRLDNDNMKFSQLYHNPNSQEFQLLEYEAENALSSLFPSTTLAKEFLGVKVNTFYNIGGIFLVNATVKLKETETTKRTSVKQQLKNELNKVINQKTEDSQLHIEEPLSPVPLVEDFDECADIDTNDCSKNGYCVNELGSFQCHCKPGFSDKFKNDRWKAGRHCQACSSEFCNNHGVCVVSKGTAVCKCSDNYMGTHCEIDREVLGVALGASIAAAIIIIVALICLYIWNRRSDKNEERMGTSRSSRIGQIYNYGNKSSTPRRSNGLSVEDRLRWHQITDTVGHVYEPHHAVKQLRTSVSPIQHHVYAAPTSIHSPVSDENHQSRPLRPSSRAPHLSESSGPYHNANQTSRDEHSSNVNQGYVFWKPRSYFS
ncbi:uncharacterized protein LOC143242587 isoform X2 [Tachypleus tridentatus]|uniref:uncharacterized protein LOC143242587 isoform X2 n=1 Tax=Tachypleus tridentatus TaxID=6853 RepID=UPI003FD60952